MHLKIYYRRITINPFDNLSQTQGLIDFCKISDIYTRFISCAYIPSFRLLKRAKGRIGLEEDDRFSIGPAKSIDLAIADIISRFIPLSRYFACKTVSAEARCLASFIRDDLGHYFAYGPSLLPVIDITYFSLSILRCVLPDPEL